MRDRISLPAASFVGLTILYLLLSTVLPGPPSTLQAYHLSNSEYHVLLFFILAPLMAVWLVAYYGYSKLRNYSGVLRAGVENTAFHDISAGVMWLVWALPVINMVALLLNTFGNNNHGFTTASNVIANYLNLIVALVAFHVISNGSRALSEREGMRVSLDATKILMFVLIAFGVLFCYVIFHNMGSTNLGSAKNPYNLPMWLLIISLVIPYLYAWCVGLLAAYELRMVSRHAKGILYRQGLQHIARALNVIIASSVLLQYSRSIFPRTGRHFSLGGELVLIYILLVIIGLGYLLLAFGANKLKKLEEI